MSFDITKFIGKFVEEAREHISIINNGLLGLEESPGEKETLNQVFRSAHTIKGSSRLLNLKPVADLTHQLEDALDSLRNDKIQASGPLFSLLFSAVDEVGRMVDEVQENGDIKSEAKFVCENLERAVKGETFLAKPEKEPDTKEAPAPKEPEKEPDTEEASAPKEPAKESGAEKPSKAPEAPARQPEKKTPRKTAAAPAETIRIGADKLDSAIKVMGEIVSNQSRLKYSLSSLDEIHEISQSCLNFINSFIENGAPKNGGGERMAAAAHGLEAKIRQLLLNTRDVLNINGLLTDDLREKVLRMRMLSLSSVLDSFPRLVRDTATSLGKKVDLVIDGADTELDKKVIEKIGDPLLHIVRNCVDHGIEMPEDRRKAEKPEKGTLRISVYYEGGHTVIEVADDGAGIPLEKIKEKARARKMYDKETLDAMSDAEVIDLIFHPGFSTSAIITDLSGRGVGMDVVKDCIVEQLKGTVQVESKTGQHTRFKIRVPLTLAILGVLQVALAGSLFAFPIGSIVEIIKVSREEIIDVVNQQAINVRDQLLPVVDLGKILGLSDDGSRVQEKEVLVVLLIMGNEKLGVIVDTLVSEDNVEMKPLPAHMKNINLVSGATISGKNEIILLLHVPRIFDLAKQAKTEKRAGQAPKSGKKGNNILVVDDSVNTREIEKSILESYGYQVDTASNGAEAFDKTKESQYDLIVTDVEMPVMDGFSLCSKLRNEPKHEQVPVIIVSSRDKPEDKKRGIEVGANAYIVKGDFRQTKLLDTVQSLLV